MPDQVKAATAFVVWVDHSELLQRRPHLIDELTDPPHYQGDLVYAGHQSGGPACDLSFSSLDEALEWARASADEVIVRPSWDPLVHYSATAALHPVGHAATEGPPTAAGPEGRAAISNEIGRTVPKGSRAQRRPLDLEVSALG